jgi:hypothetical protein
MIVFCMSCKHADHVCDQLRRNLRNLEIPYRVEWIGVGEGREGQLKSPAENTRLLKEFKEGKIQILVQVGKVDEGFDACRASVLVFLHLIGSDPKLFQQIGRGLRRNYALRFEVDSVSVYASADTPLADVIRRMQVFAEDIIEEMEDSRFKPSGPTDQGPFIWPIPDLIIIDTRYRDTTLIYPDGCDPLSPEQMEFCRRFNIPVQDYLSHFGGAMPSRPAPPPESGFTPPQK